MPTVLPAIIATERSLQQRAGTRRPGWDGTDPVLDKGRPNTRPPIDTANPPLGNRPLPNPTPGAAPRPAPAPQRPPPAHSRTELGHEEYHRQFDSQTDLFLGAYRAARDRYMAMVAQNPAQFVLFPFRADEMGRRGLQPELSDLQRRHQQQRDRWGSFSQFAPDPAPAATDGGGGDLGGGNYGGDGGDSWGGGSDVADTIGGAVGEAGGSPGYGNNDGFGSDPGDDNGGFGGVW